MNDPRLDRLADVLVRYSLNVRRGELVSIKVPPLAEPLTVAVVKRVLRAGGHPVVRSTPPVIEEWICRLGKAEQLDYLDPAELELMRQANCYIAIWADENTRALSRVDPKRSKARSLARKPLLDVLMKRSAQEGPDKLRWVCTQFPCHASAQEADMSLFDYAEFVFRAGLLHLDDPAAAWKKSGKAQERLCKFLDKAREIRFTAPNGTDLTVNVEGRRWVNCSGLNNFPDGEVFTGPHEDATHGVVNFSFPAVYNGREVTEVSLHFKDGKVVDASAGKNEAFLFQMMDQDEGGRTLGEIAIGTNYGIEEYSRNTLFDEKIGGTFHAALGAAYPETGGTNESGLHWDMVCDLRNGGRIEVDGKPIMEDGRFLRDSWPQPQ